MGKQNQEKFGKMGKFSERNFCSKCRKTKSVGAFGKNRSRKTGLDCWCKICRKNLRNPDYMREYRKQHKKRLSNQRKKWREVHYKDLFDQHKKWVVEHPKKVKLQRTRAQLKQNMRKGYGISFEDIAENMLEREREFRMINKLIRRKNNG